MKFVAEETGKTYPDWVPSNIKPTMSDRVAYSGPSAAVGGERLTDLSLTP